MKIHSYVEESHKQFWPQFCNWCAHNNIEVLDDNETDCKDWWNCFLAGLTAMYIAIKQNKVE